MKIALLGYGKMGQTIEKIAVDRGHTIVLKKSIDDSFDGLEQADVAIDFSVPSAAVENITKCLESGIAIVSGTTGWLEDYEKMVDKCKACNGAFIYGSNFSLGVNLFFELNEHLSRLMQKFPEYKSEIKEIHHSQKLDAPSGTAITLAKTIIENSDYSSWALKKQKEDELFIDAVRTDNVPGTHTVYYKNSIDTIEITHTAHSREGFAQGAVIAAEWLLEKKGVFTMKDVLNLK